MYFEEFLWAHDEKNLANLIKESFNKRNTCAFHKVALDSLKEPISIHTPIYSDAGDTIYLLDQIASPTPEYDKETLLSLKKAINSLKEREKEIIYSRYIVGKTQTELSKELNISQAQVSRIESSALTTLKRLVK